MALHAKLYLDADIFFLILRSEIVKMMCLTKYNSARSAVKNFVHNLSILWIGVLQKVFCGASRQIIFGWRHLFSDFAKQNQKKDASIQRIFRRRRRRKPFYSSPQIALKILGKLRKL